MRENYDFRCLHDAGMPQEMIQQCTHLLQNQQEDDAITMLKNWRSVLLTQLHKSQKQIDCLDFFIEILKKNDCRRRFIKTEKVENEKEKAQILLLCLLCL